MQSPFLSLLTVPWSDCSGQSMLWQTCSNMNFPNDIWCIFPFPIMLVVRPCFSKLNKEKQGPAGSWNWTRLVKGACPELRWSTSTFTLSLNLPHASFWAKHLRCSQSNFPQVGRLYQFHKSSAYAYVYIAISLLAVLWGEGFSAAGKAIQKTYSSYLNISSWDVQPLNVLCGTTSSKSFAQP